MADKKTVLAKARAWAVRKKLFGAQAFFRYVILSFIENLNRASDDFVFNGGNLLWVYIATPRATIDLDLVTEEADSHAAVRSALVAACEERGDIRFSLTGFKEVEQEGKSGCVATVKYTTDQGASNSFNIDVVYAIDTDSHEIESPVNEGRKIRAATAENIIADKLAACHRYRSGNTRMKDYDDLWRLGRSSTKVNRRNLKHLCSKRKIPLQLDVKWISADLERAWSSHHKRYKDLPEDLQTVFTDVNEWLGG